MKKILLILCLCLCLFLCSCSNEEKTYTFKKGEIGVTYLKEKDQYDVFIFKEEKHIYVDRKDTEIIVAINSKSKRDIVYQNGKLYFYIEWQN